jgi:hypothetical protein
MSADHLAALAESWIAQAPDPVPRDSTDYVRRALRECGIELDVLGVEALWQECQRRQWATRFLPLRGDLAIFRLNRTLHRAGIVRCVGAGKVSVVELAQGRFWARTYDVRFAGIHGWARPL